MSAYHHNYGAFGRLVLNAGFMEAEMLKRAERGKAAAEAVAPDATPYGTGFKYRFSASSGKHGGIHHDRAYGRVENDDPDAVYIVFGTSDTPDHRYVFGAAADAMGS